MWENDEGWNQKIQNYNNWLSKGDKKEIHWANLKRRYSHCYDYSKTALALDNKTLSEDEMSNVDTAKRKAPLTEKTKFIYAGKTEN